MHERTDVAEQGLLGPHPLPGQGTRLHHLQGKDSGANLCKGPISNRPGFAQPRYDAITPLADILFVSAPADISWVVHPRVPTLLCADGGMACFTGTLG